MSRGVNSGNGPEAGLAPKNALTQAQEELRLNQPITGTTVLIVQHSTATSVTDKLN